MAIIKDCDYILSHLVFYHEANESDKRWPNPAQENYQTLHKLLDEVHFLLKVWRKRTLYPFCDHLHYKHQGDQARVPDLGYSQDTLFRYQAASSRNLIPAVQVPDLTDLNRSSLRRTKEVYLMSSRIFYEIFLSEKEFLATLSVIEKIRADIFSILFRCYVSGIPKEVLNKLPMELWEKICLCSLTPHDTDNVCLSLRNNVQPFRNLEQNRLNQLFGAVGNLHMIIFDILIGLIFSPMKTQTSTILNSQHKGRFRATHAFFYEHTRSISTRAFRLMNLDHLAAFTDGQNVLAQEPSCSLEDKIRQGIWVSESVDCLHYANESCPSWEAVEDLSSVDWLNLNLRNHCSSSIVVTAESYWNNPRSTYYVWDFDKRRVTDTITFDSRPPPNVDIFVMAVSLTAESLVMLIARTASTPIAWQLWTWKLVHRATPLTLKDATFMRLQGLSFVDVDSHFFTLVTSASNDYLIHSSSTEESSLSLLNPDTGVIDKQYHFNHSGSITDLKDELLLLGSASMFVPSTNVLFDMSSFRVIEEYRSYEMCHSGFCSRRQSNSNQHQNTLCTYYSRFDANKSSKKFVVFNTYLSYYQVMRYDKKNDTMPEMLYRGSFEYFDMPLNVSVSAFVNDLFLVPRDGFDRVNCTATSLYAVSLTKRLHFPIFIRPRRPTKYPSIPNFPQPKLNSAHKTPISGKLPGGNRLYCFMLNDGRLICVGHSYQYNELHLNLSLEQAAELEMACR